MDIPMYVAYSPNEGQKVQVYRNLTRSCWSIRHKGRVIAHAVAVYLTDCAFKVQEGGRQRVLRERRKNVHAFVVGVGAYEYRLTEDMVVPVVYNPYKMHSFETRDGAKVLRAKQVWFSNTGGVFAQGVA
jgi:hypothetical protein